MKLSVELVPATCWFSNVRSAVSKAEWDRIRRAVYAKAWDTCEICGGFGPKHPVECHEIWSYDDAKLIQKLEGMIALCPNCHQCKHYGFAQIQGKDEQAFLHLMKVNKLTKKKTEKYLIAVFEQWYQRSHKNWVLDISYLSRYGIDTSKIEPRSIA
jgi:hypothetical protein